jgi:uncharacterized alkaline shock family protein YloU
MSVTTEEKLGTVKISDDIIAICAMNATIKTPGVAELSSGFSENISKNIFGKEPLYRGIKVSQNENGILIDINVIVNYGVKIPEVAWDIQKSVKAEVEHMTDTAVRAVNIHVQGVNFVDEKGEED